MALKTELVSFAVKPGMESEAEAWMQMLIDRQAECVATLDAERMHYESIFKCVRDGRLYLTWFSVQGEGGAGVRASSAEVDRLHVRYWERCIDRTVGPVVFGHVVSFVPETVADAVAGRATTLSGIRR